MHIPASNQVTLHIQYVLLQWIVILQNVICIFTVFCVYYVFHGLLAERPYEVIVMVLATVVILIYIVVNYILSTKNDVKLVSFVLCSKQILFFWSSDKLAHACVTWRKTCYWVQGVLDPVTLHKPSRFSSRLMYPASDKLFSVLNFTHCKHSQTLHLQNNTKERMRLNPANSLANHASVLTTNTVF